MKQYRIFLIVFLLSIALLSKCSTISLSGKRVWDIAIDNLSTADVIESKICSLDESLQDSFIGTFTMLTQLVQKSNSVNSSLDIIQESTSAIDNYTMFLESKALVIDNTIESLIPDLEQIHIEDFGATWTALDALNITLQSKFDVAVSETNTIESILDVLSATQQSHFVDTFTALQVVAENVLNSMMQLESLSDQLITDLSEVDNCILLAKDTMTTVESKIDVLDIEIAINAAGTFTAIDAIQAKICASESALDDLFVLIQTNQSATFTALAAVEAKLISIDSKIDLFDLSLSQVDSFIDEIGINITDSYSKACFIESALDATSSDIQTIDSKIDQIIIKTDTIESNLDDLVLQEETIIAKSCTISSFIDVINETKITTESTLDLVSQSFETIISRLDTLSFNTLLSKICTIESYVENIAQTEESVSSKIDLLLDNVSLVESIADDLITDAYVTEDKVCTIESKLSAIENNIIATGEPLLSIESSVDHISSIVDLISMQALTIEGITNAIESQLDQINMRGESILSKICFIETDITTIISNLDNLEIIVAIDQIALSNLTTDMQETWTILSAIEEKMDCVIAQELSIESKLDMINVQVDFSGVFTVLDVIEQKACNALDSVFTLESNIDSFNADCIIDLGVTFTAISAVYNEVCAAESSVDILLVDIQNIVDSSGSAIGTPLTPSDFSDTFSIVVPGRYYLTDDIDFNPGGEQAIYVDADDVHIDMCNRTIQQIGANLEVHGITVAPGHCNVSIANGNIIGFQGHPLRVGPECKFLRLNNLFISGSSSGVSDNVFLGNPVEIFMIRDCRLEASSGLNQSDVIDITKSFNFFILNSSFNHGANSGIKVNESAGFCIRNCGASGSSNVGNHAAGISLRPNSFSTATPNKNFVIDSCVCQVNQRGISITENARNGVIINNILNNNVNTGLEMNTTGTQLLESVQKVCVVHNILSNNAGGIRINADGKNNYFAFNQMVENTTANFVEDAGEGPNSILGNMAYKTAGTNYSAGTSVINSVSLSQSAAFPSPEPKYWINVSMAP